MIPDLYLYASSNISINTIGLLPVINFRSLPQDRWGNKMLKRFFDVSFSVLFFILLGWWLMPAIALIIKLSSKGPIFFKQERWGLNNQKITCYKFRTMYYGSPETDENGGFLQATKNDSRITPIGKIFREWNIDELPQFWNVLKGNMSVVGPRPHVTPLNISSIQNVDRYMLRHLVKPGITGWAQINGRDDISITDKVKLEQEYLYKKSFLFDIEILIKTFTNVLFSKGVSH